MDATLCSIPLLTVSSATRGNHLQTSRRGDHRGPGDIRRSVADPQSNRYVNLDKFDLKVGEWDNCHWYHQFEFIVTHYNWEDPERTSCVMFEGPCTDSPPKLLSDSTQHIYTAVLQEREREREREREGEREGGREVGAGDPP